MSREEGEGRQGGIEVRAAKNKSAQYGRTELQADVVARAASSVVSTSDRAKLQTLVPLAAKMWVLVTTTALGDVRATGTRVCALNA